ncbi:Na+/H+ antiporter NhaC family protein [Halegenticoccus tardaugens]|uniref:Na+/H+ antiporter NhaC family protein n=1 Tax=Halegenticoccus tardaugens TaxID=2071624 RepID=UPI00100A2EE1|nr:Na+/H+ antiporter NhaC family protein [Halegenticoccus tardaugens]
MATLSFEPLTYDDIPEYERPTLRQALVPVVGMLAFLSVGAIGLGLDAQMPLLWGVVFTGLVGRYWIGISWRRMYEGIVDGLRMGMQAILIIFVIYVLIAVWTAAGTIPALVYYGLDLLTPAVFLPVTALLATGVAFAVGSSWTTAGTLGVAFIGIGAGLGVPEPMTAGAVLTGAYTGDKISPLSDTTNLAAAVTNTDLLTHIRTMRVGTGIALGLSLVGYAVLGLTATGSIPAGRVAEIQTAITGAYSIHPVVFLPLLVTFGLALRGYPALPSLTVGVFAGVATQVFAQNSVVGPFVDGVAAALGAVAAAPLSPAAYGDAVAAVGSGLAPFTESFVTAWDVAQNGAAPETGVAIVNDLLATEGLIGAAWTITIVVAALALGGMLERTGVLAVLAHRLSKSISSVSGLTAGTAASAFGMNVLAAEQYMSIVVPGMSLRGLYDDFDLESRNLSRAVEAAGTTTSALVPWNAGGVYMAGVLGVPTLEYAPYYFLGILSPLILVAMGATGWRITKKSEETQAGIAGAVKSLGDD